MNDLHNYMERQMGLSSRLNYDNILRRLVVRGEDSFYGFQNSPAVSGFDQDPPIFACRFAETAGFEHILALANEDGRVAIQNTQAVKPYTVLEGHPCHNNSVFDLTWQPHHMNFVTVSGDHTACLWDVQQSAPRRLLVFSSHTKSVKTAVFRPDSPAVFASGARDGHILVWDVRAGAQPAVVLKPDNCLINCHSSFAPKTPGSHSKRRADLGRPTSITGLVFQDDQTLISCGECDGNIKVWDLRKNYNVYKREPLPKHSIPYCGSSAKNGYTNLIIDDARMRLYASCMDNVIYCYNISTYNYLPEQRYVGHENSTFYVKTGLSPDSKYLVSGSSDKNAYIWNVKYSQPIVKLSGHYAEVTCAAWCRLGDAKIVTCSDDARHKIWRIGQEFHDMEEKLQLRGCAEVVPHTNIILPQWGTLDQTPKSLKRKQLTPTSFNGKRKRNETGTVKKTKRCLTEMLNASRSEDDSETKRARLELPSVQEETEDLPAGIKRHAEPLQKTPTKKSCMSQPGPSSDWSYISPQSSASFLTPTKNYERKYCKKLSPKSPKAISPKNVSPVKEYPVAFGTPTKHLPNFVVDGSAPHHRLMSPAKKLESNNWLARLTKERKVKCAVKEGDVGSPLSPTQSAPSRRNSTTERTPRAAGKTRTLLKYFYVASKEK